MSKKTDELLRKICPYDKMEVIEFGRYLYYKDGVLIGGENARFFWPLFCDDEGRIRRFVLSNEPHKVFYEDQESA